MNQKHSRESLWTPWGWAPSKLGAYMRPIYCRRRLRSWWLPAFVVVVPAFVVVVPAFVVVVPAFVVVAFLCGCLHSSLPAFVVVACVRGGCLRSRWLPAFVVVAGVRRRLGSGLPGFVVCILRRGRHCSSIVWLALFSITVKFGLSNQFQNKQILTYDVYVSLLPMFN